LASGALLAGSAFGKEVVQGASKVGAKILKMWETSGKAIAQHIPKSMLSAANPATLAKSIAMGAG
jgi:hypothetical protein